MIALLATLTFSLPAEEYRLPPADVVAIVDAEPAPGVDFSPDGKWMLLVERDAMPSVADLARRMLRLAGMRIDPAANGRFQTDYAKGLVLKETDGDGRRLVLPAGARLADVRWSHDSKRFAFSLVRDGGSELWYATVDDPTPKRVSDALNTVLGSFGWMPDGTTLLFREVPGSRGPEPAEPRVPEGPNVQETGGETSPLRTYQDLLSNPYDEALFEYYTTVQLVTHSTTTGERTTIGKPALLGSVSASPSGELLLVTRVEHPFSYVMPWSKFPHVVEVWNVAGERVHTVAEVPLEQNVPIGGVATGPRGVIWKAGEPATLLWTEALDGGDPKREVEARDRVLAHSAPFRGEAKELFRVPERCFGVTFLADTGHVIAAEYDRDRRWTRALVFDLGKHGSEPVVIEDRSIRDRYGDPGNLVTAPDAAGDRVVVQHGPWVYRTGRGATPQGYLPFLDRQNLETLETERMWRCEPGAYEVVVDVLDPQTFLTRRETPETPPNYWRHSSVGEGGIRVGTRLALTEFPDPTPQIRGITKQLVKYERKDGVPLSATLYLPAGYEKGTKLPLFVWAYPIEFNDAATAGQIGASPWSFTQLRGPSHLTLVTQGWAVMDGATMPVIGDPETMNDTFIEQIVGAAEAAIEKAVELGVTDGEHSAIGGHSYGAFMTANVLAHCDHYKAGIARSGAYNRSLTPFGFQSERRTIWEAPETYFTVSPFFHANAIDEPLLLIHGEVDNNSGTFPMQSRRLFQAIQGTGGTARLVMLPYESHGYRGRESVLHVLAEMIDWLDVHVKGEAVEASYSR